VLNDGRRLGAFDSEPDLRLSFAQGDVVFFAAWEEAFSYYTIELLSKSGRLNYARSGELVEWQSVEPDPQFPGYSRLSDRPEKIETGMSHCQLQVVEQLARHMNGQAAELCSGSDALRTLSTMRSILN